MREDEPHKIKDNCMCNAGRHVRLIDKVPCCKSSRGAKLAMLVSLDNMHLQLNKPSTRLLASDAKIAPYLHKFGHTVLGPVGITAQKAGNLDSSPFIHDKHQMAIVDSRFE